MRRSYLDYAMSVIIGRALPDVRDGLKPVHRRVLWAMNELGNTYNKAYKKSARVVGDVIGKYHPHGDTAVYDTIVRMAQDFSMRYTLIDGQGNFGSVDGDNPAAMRYTEVRMARITNEVLADIEKETVDFQSNYDESLREPTVLPTRIPNLLLNGSEGIAVGMSTKIAPHNLTEIVDATIAVLRDPEVDTEDLLKIVKGPDFPTRGFICGREEIKESYRTGRGILQMRARASIDRIGRGSHERDAVIVSELPYQVNKAKLIERIAELANEKRLEGIAEVRDESDRQGMRIVVELKRDAVPQVVLNKLFKLTPMQSSFGVINLAIVNGQPRVLKLKEILEYFIDFRREVVRRRTEYELIIKLVAELEEILAHEPSLRRVIIEELEEVKKEFGDARRTEITDAGTDYSIEDLIADEEVAITVTKSGYIKRTPVTTYSRQGRGGKGRFGAMAKNEDYIEHLFIASTHAYLMVFTDDGLVYKMKVHEVPDAAAASRGKAIVNLIQIPAERTLAGVVPVREFSEGRYVLMVTKKGVIKKTSLADFQNIRSNGIIAINIDEGDELLDVVLTDGTKRIFIATHNGFAIRFDEKNARPMGRATRGTRGIDLRQDDFVVSLCAVSADDSEKMLSVSERGYGKQTPI